MEGRRLSRPEWLVTYRNKVPPPGVEPGHGHPYPSTNGNLIDREQRVTTMPNCQPAEAEYIQAQ